MNGNVEERWMTEGKVGWEFCLAEQASWEAADEGEKLEKPRSVVARLPYCKFYSFPQHNRSCTPQDLGL